MTPLPWHETTFARLLRERARLPHALLIHGRQGIGKLAFAQALARALVCEAPRADGAPCGTCAACGWCMAGSHPDWIDVAPAAEDDESEAPLDGERAASREITVKQIRGLADFINLSSHRGGAKIVLLHPAESLNVNAANALLKSLEEPPPNTFFLLVSHRPHFLLPTIKSRCSQIAAPVPSREAAEAWLAKQSVPNPALALAQSGDAPLLAMQLTDTAWWEQRATLLDAIAKAHFDPLALAEALRDVPVPRLVEWLQKWTFDSVLLKFLGRIRYNPDYAGALKAAAGRTEALSLIRFHRDVVRMQRVVHHPLNPRLVIEDLLLGYAEAADPNTVWT
jgi:DNA polymerase-3 subunit delta'